MGVNMLKIYKVLCFFSWWKEDEIKTQFNHISSFNVSKDTL